MKLIYRQSDREIIAKVAPGSISEHILSWDGEEPVLAPGYAAVNAALSLDVREPSKYETDGRVTKIPAPLVVDKIALLEAELLTVKSRLDSQESKVTELEGKVDVKP